MTGTPAGCFFFNVSTPSFLWRYSKPCRRHAAARNSQLKWLVCVEHQTQQRPYVQQTKQNILSYKVLVCTYNKLLAWKGVKCCERENVHSATCCERESTTRVVKVLKTQIPKRTKNHGNVIVNQFASPIGSLVPSTVVVTTGQEVLFSTSWTCSSPKQTKKTSSTRETDPEQSGTNLERLRAGHEQGKHSFCRFPQNRGHERQI